MKRINYTLTDWKKELGKKILLKRYDSFTEKNCLRKIFCLPDDVEEWQELHFIQFLNAIDPEKYKKK